ncbi:MAG: cob(I)yrinic acid a,c-diamide adenosyltransferase [Dehalococcoidia bacterium]|nr:cob(I)yrinic acid a,c-diamide adenosyltransferase [Dehalococcoidia bacterium]
MKIYTRKGDGGETSLLYGVRVPKDDPRCEAYGAVDEAVSALGVAYAAATKERTRQLLRQVERELFVVGSELATPPEHYAKSQQRGWVITEAMVAVLEQAIDELEPQVQMPTAFIAPGTNPASAALDLARAVLRRAERRLVTLHRQGGTQNPALLQYLNRLNDLVYMLARFEEDPQQRIYI